MRARASALLTILVIGLAISVIPSTAIAPETFPPYFENRHEALQNLDAFDLDFYLVHHELLIDEGYELIAFRLHVAEGTPWESLKFARLMLPLESLHPKPSACWPLLYHHMYNAMQSDYDECYPEKYGIARLQSSQFMSASAGPTFDPYSNPYAGGTDYTIPWKNGGPCIPPEGQAWFIDFAGEGDQLCAIELLTYLLNRKEVFELDEDNVGATGSSYGALQTWFYASTDLSGVTWNGKPAKWRTIVPGCFTGGASGLLFPNYLTGDEDNRYYAQQGSGIVRRLYATARILKAPLYIRTYEALLTRTDYEWLEEEICAWRSASPLYPDRWSNLLQNVDSEAIFIQKGQRGMDFAVNDHMFVIEPLLEAGFQVKVLIYPRDHNGLCYDPNWIYDSESDSYIKAVCRLNEPGYSFPLATSPEAHQDLGARQIFHSYKNDQVDRWFRYWLKGEDTGIMDEPMFTFLESSIEPGDSLDPLTGYERFQFDEPPEVKELTYYLTEDGDLTPYRPSEGYRVLENDYDGTPVWPDIFLQTEGWTRDALIYLSTPLDTDQVMLGSPKVHLVAESDGAEYQVFVSLYDVDPTTGDENLVTWADAFEFETGTGLAPDVLNVEGNFRVYRFKQGHQIKIELSNVGQMIRSGGQGVRGSPAWWTRATTVLSNTKIFSGQGQLTSYIKLPVLPP